MTEEAHGGNARGGRGNRKVGRPPARTRRPRPAKRVPTLAQILSTAVEFNPDSIAVVAVDGTLTYRELDERSSRLARILIARGMGTESGVALANTRSASMIVSIWAVAKTGAFYIPVDPGYPAERIEFMLDDSGATCGITTTEFRSVLPDSVDWIVLGDGSDEEAIAGEAADPVGYADRLRPIAPNNVAYMIFTSGSTGRPKGVEVTHSGLSGLAETIRDRCEIDRSSRMLAVATPSFDVSLFEMLGAFSSGIPLVIAPPDAFGGEPLTEWLRTTGVTHAFITPSVLQTLVLDGLTDLRTVVGGGEAVSPELVTQVARDGRRMMNGFGPTETTVVTSLVELLPGEPVSIGGLLPAVTAHILDTMLRPVPAGVAGELYIAGVGLARGYHNRPSLTSERFVASPFGEPGSRLYRTGDVVRGRANGVIEYLGRSDFQVKVRGFRIELGEIDSALAAHPGVGFSVTIGHQLADGSMTLVSYVMPRPGADIDPDELTAFVGKSLAAYMVPAEIVRIDEVPLTPVGKLDRAALPAPTIGTSRKEYREPQSETELVVASALADLLGIERVGLDDNFFELGGNSLIATQAVARLNAAVGSTSGVREIFESRTVAELAARVEANRGGNIRPVLERRPRPDVLPLSFAQQRMWLTNQFDTTSIAYNQPIALRISGSLDIGALEQAFGDLIGRHEPLRTVYPDTDDGPVQDIRPASEVILPLVSEQVEESELWTTVTGFISRGYDVSSQTPLRARLFQLAEDSWVLVVVSHHIASDGGSLTPLVRDLMLAYSARMQGVDPEFAELPVEYADYALWHREMLGEESDPESLIARQISFWKAALAGSPEVLELPADRPRPDKPSGRGDLVEFEISPDVAQQLNAYAQHANSTLFMTVHAALAVLLSRLAATDDVSIGTQIAGRGEQSLDDLVGMFGNTLVLRSVVSPDQPFDAFLSDVRSTDLQALGEADVPLDRLIEILRPARSLAYTPLFQVLLMLQNFERTEIRLPGVTIEVIDDVEAAIAKLDLTITLVEEFNADGSAGRIRGSLLYATDLFDRGTMEAFAGRFVEMLAAVAADPSRPVGDLPLLLPEETGQRELIGSDSRPMPDETLVDGFRRAVAANGSRTAVVFEDEQISYRDFGERVFRLAHHLVGIGVGPEVTVAVAARRSIDMLVAIYAVLEAGGAYVPIDPDHPDERNEYVLASARPAVVLTTTRDRADLPVFESIVVIDELDLTGHPAGPIADTDRPTPLRARNTAYLIYTSGSTGNPKGVAVEHRSVLNQLLWMRERYDLDHDDVMLHKTPVTFDASVWELFLPLQLGATLVIARPEGHLDVGYLLDLTVRYQFAILEFVPSMLELFITEATADLPPSLRYLSIGGEELSADLVRRAADHSSAVLDNTYGPTEATVTSTVYRTSAADTVVPIGSPIRNTGARVLDSRLHEVPVGVPGELYLTGVQLARGYHGRADLTAERFVADPLTPGTRMYRTGDLVVVRPDGGLRFLGRTDFQIKLRGLRIELGEIESALSEHEDVARAVAILYSHPSTGDAVVGYVVPAPGTTPEPHQLLEFVSRRLPAYMVPAQILPLDRIPLSPSGKLDRRALPAPAFDAGDREYRAPGTISEKLIADVFAALLDVDRVSVDDSFFELGGHSLLAMRAVARINDALSASIGIRELFESPTVARLAATIDTRSVTARRRPPLEPCVRPARIPLSPAQQRMWFVNQFDTGSAAYNIPLVIRLTGTIDADVLRLAVADVLARHETLRTTYPHADGTPYQLIGEAQSVADRFTIEDLDETMVATRVSALVTAGFDVTTEVPVRGALLRMSPNESVLVFVVHHISADGYSMSPLAADVMAAYAARTSGADNQWPPLYVQYADFSIWQRQMLGSESDVTSVAAEQENYWRAQLAGLPERIDLPLDHVRPPIWSGAGGAAALTIDGELHDGLDELARSQGATLFMVVHSALAVLLARLSGSEDIAIGAPIAGRGSEALDGLVGMFVNTLVLRTNVDAAGRFSDLVAQAKAVDLDAFAHADIPFERLVEVLAPARSTAHHALFQVGLAFQNLERTRFELGDLVVERYESGVHPAKFDLSLEIVALGEGSGRLGDLSVEITYATDLFESATVQRFGERLVGVLAAVVGQPDIAVGDIDILGNVERRAILGDSQGSVAGVPDASTLPEILDAAVRANPDGVAVVAREKALTYRELDARSTQLARVLIERGVGAESIVALALPRSSALVEAIWAVAKTGAAWVPVDPKYPADRIEFMLSDAGARVGLRGAADGHLPSGRVEWLSIDDPEFADEVGRQVSVAITDADRVRPVSVDNTAYMIYTSGSTGRPKGVAVTHSGLTALVAEQRERYRIDGSARVLAVASPSFDASVFELLMAVGSAATLVVSPPEVFGGDDLGLLLARERVSHAVITPSVLESVDPALLPELRVVVTAGEACPPDLVRRFVSGGRRMFNGFGPTESTIMSNCAQLVPDAAVTIGGPIRGATTRVLDQRLAPVPRGVVGELYLSGVGLARGYHQRPDLTADRFVADPLSAVPGTRMYRTGDLVRMGADGSLEYLGRTDFQVKVRGFRIELGEIDSALTRHPDVTFAVTLGHQLPDGTNALVAYVVPLTGTGVTAAELSAFLRGTLAEYMVPAEIMVIDSVPLTPVGKLDRAALPQPGLGTSTVDYREPRTEAERIITDVLAGVLGVERVGLDDDFFALGGDSIVSIQLVSRARAAGLVLEPRDVFEHRTAAALAAVARPAGTGVEPLREIEGGGTGTRPLTPIEHFMIRRGGAYRRFSQVVVLEIPASAQDAAVAATVQAVIDRHDMLRARLIDDGDGHLVETAPPGSVNASELITRVDYDPAIAHGELERIARGALDAALDRLSPADGRMLQCVRLAPIDSTEPGRMIVAAHHLAVDGVSWRIIIPDLVTAAMAIDSGADVILPPTGTSMRTWATLFADKAVRGDYADELDYWQRVIATPDPLLGARALDPQIDVAARTEKISVTVPGDVSDVVLTTTPVRFRGNVNDGLLAALALAVARRRRETGTASQSLLLRLEGHGRESDHLPGADLSRTVGWFTTSHPVALDLSSIDIDDAFAATSEAGRAVKLVKEQLKGVPGQGLGYGVLRYLDVTAGELLAGPAGQISFNYLGRVSTPELPAGVAGIGWTPATDITTLGDVRMDADMPANAVLDINAITVGDELTATFAFPSDILTRGEVSLIADYWVEALQSIADHSVTDTAGGLTPSDAALVRLSQNDIDRLESQTPAITDLWPLSPLQAGLFVHSTMQGDAPDVYVVQMVLELGGDVDVPRLRDAARALLSRYDSLRATFATTVDGVAVQVISDIGDVAWIDHDLDASTAESEVARRLAAERARPFDLGTAPLVRFMMLRTGDRHVLSIMAHHIVIDGWSMPLLIKDLLTLYAVRGDAAALPNTESYRGYLAWLARQDRQAAIGAWTDAFSGSEDPTLLSGIADPTALSSDAETMDVTIEEATTARLAELSSRLGITLNTVIQTAWGLLLARSLNRDDVVFGTTVSGRPADLPGVETMIGLFINTLPVRIVIDESETISELLTRVQTEQRALLDHHHLGLAEIITVVGPGAAFDSLSVLETYPVDEEGLRSAASIDGMAVTGANVLDATHYPISIITFADSTIRTKLRYLTDAFSADEAARIGRRFVRVLEAVAADSLVLVRDVDVLDGVERELVGSRWAF
ncbi:UNVERIFIED_CONTAM: non-ribosomal peptide synthase protein (TIGR01720 family)/amino acid adenylation domain-containing protein, partial [Williamsia faeni]